MVLPGFVFVLSIDILVCQNTKYQVKLSVSRISPDLGSSCVFHALHHVSRLPTDLSRFRLTQEERARRGQ